MKIKSWCCAFALLLTASGFAQQQQIIREEKMLTGDENRSPFLDEDADGIPEQHWQWKDMNLSRTGSNGKLFNHTAQNWTEYYSYVAAKGSSSMVANGSWTLTCCSTVTHTTGSSGAMGRMNCVRMDPSNSNIVYAGSPVGGLWKSTDGGDTWTCLTDGLPRTGVTDVAINPLNGNEIYILSGDGDYGLTPSLGVIKTMNGGYTWQATGLTFPASQLQYGRKLLMNPSNPQELYAATTAGLFKTSDGGYSWIKVLVNTNITDLKLKPGTPSTVYASGNNRFYRSLTSGSAWDSSGVITPNATRISIGTTAAGPSQVYLLVGTWPDSSLVYMSSSSGAPGTFMLKQPSPNTITGQTNDMAIEVNPSAASEVYAGILDLHKSTTSGTAFSQITQWSYWPSLGGLPYIHADIHDIEMQNGILYVANDGGIYKSTDNGATWSEKNNGLSVAWITSLAQSDSFPNRMYFGSFDNGIHTRNGGSTSTNVFGGDGFNCTIDYTNELTAYANVNFGLQKTTDGGNTWNFCVANIGPTVIDPVNPNILYAAGQRVYKTINGGTSWSSLLADSSYGHSALEISQSDPNIIYVAERPGPVGINDTSSRLIQRWDGLSWSNIKGNLPSVWNYGFCPSDIAIDPSDPLHVWVTFLGYENGLKVFETVNGGITWLNKSGSLPNVMTNTIAFHPGSNNGVYVGTDVGIFYRDNSFTDWVPFMNGLPVLSITDLVVDISHNKIYASTIGRGIWESDVFTSCQPSYNFTGSPFNTQNGFKYYQASGTILSDRLISSSYGNNITYRAGDYTRLVPGFEVSAGAIFTAKAAVCTNPAKPQPNSGAFTGDDIFAATSAERQEEKQVNVPCITAYPNPCSGLLTVSFLSHEREPVYVYLEEMSGKRIDQFIGNESFSEGTHTFTVTLQHHAPGIYVLTYRAGSKTERKKIIRL